MNNKRNKKKNQRVIEVKSYNPRWKKEYEIEAGKIKDIFKDIIIGIHHIGSTAIKGIKAKLVIDILVEVEDIDKVNNFNKQMESLGYVPKGENGIEGRRYFRKGEPQHTHHVHIFKVGNEEIERHINFKDYLNIHPEEAKKYSLLKEKLAKKYRFDALKYTEEKNEFINGIDLKAKEWKFRKGNDV